MNESNFMAWGAIGLAAAVALYLKGYIRLPAALAHARDAPAPDRSRAIDGMTSAQLVYLAAVQARKEAERDVGLAKSEELARDLLAHFKSPFSGPPAPPTPPGPPPHPASPGPP